MCISPQLKIRITKKKVKFEQALEIDKEVNQLVEEQIWQRVAQRQKPWSECAWRG